jgi:hypothetical protein
MLREALDKQTFLKSWLQRHGGFTNGSNLRATLARVGAGRVATGAGMRQ